MILEQETYEKYGYKPSELSDYSTRLILVKCDFCGIVFEKSKSKINYCRTVVKTDSCRNGKCTEKKERQTNLIKYGSEFPFAKPRKSKKIGEKYGFWTVIEESNYKRDSCGNIRQYVKCQCICGYISEIDATRLGKTSKSCGCAGKPYRKTYQKYESNYDGCKSLYYSWNSMKSRCYGNKNNSTYREKNIKVCEEWLYFKNFKKWSLEHGYERGLSLDRIDPDKNYCPENCEWVTRSENSKRVTSERDKIIKNLRDENLYLKSILDNHNIKYEHVKPNK